MPRIPILLPRRPGGLTALLLLAASCTHHPAAINGPGRGTGPGYSWPEESAGLPGEYQSGHAYGLLRHTGALSSAAPPAEQPYLLRATPEPVPPRLTEGGATCLRELRRAGVGFRKLASLKGVQTPVEVHGSIGGVQYWVSGQSALQMDCRLALTLSKVSSVLVRHGVTRVRFSGAYVYKRAPSGRLSHHAYGLAIDLHEFSVRGQKLSVDRAFARNAGCHRKAPALNRIACDLRATNYFDEFLTPDFNAAHRDHLHISIPRP